MYVIGTAGHVDHGKSALVKALTGIDPDRLQEEKDRGLTIDLGFAWLRLPSGEEVSIVDVPGHERFVKNMLAGVGGIDLTLLVVAADEGVMPQTREHLAILDLLGVQHGLVALSKIDLVDDHWLELVRDEVHELIASTVLGRAPIVACSARTGRGLEQLVQELATVLQEIPPPRDIGRPRLPIDRAFTLPGFGTVVTGTLMDGSMCVDQELELLPTGRRVRIRGLQNHKQKVAQALPGRRTAVNISGLPVALIERGMQLVRPGSVPLVSLADVRLRVLDGFALRHGIRCVVHHYAAEVETRVTLFEGNTLERGEGWGQLRLSSALGLMRGDHFVLRAGGQTIAGGEVVDLPARRQPRGRVETIARLTALSTGAASEAYVLVERFGPVTREEIVARASGSAIADELAEEEIGERLIYCAPFYVTAEQYEKIAGEITRLLERYHETHPLRQGMSREEMRRHLSLSPEFADALFSVLEGQRLLRVDGTHVALAGWSPRLTPDQSQALREFVTALEQSPFSPEAPPIDKELVAYASESGQVIKVGDLFFARSAYDEMLRRIIEQAKKKPITLAQVRDMFGTSRRYAQAMLEHMDAQRITRRIGDARVLREARAIRDAEPQSDVRGSAGRPGQP
jgi:selenocysteine-specific elongation factor